MTNQEIAKALNSLIETLKDGEEGFRLAAADSTSPEIKSVCQELSAQRATFAGQLQTHVRNLGKEYETEPTVAGSLHRGWINLKSALTGGSDHAIMAECERGEDHAVEVFRSTLAENALPATVAPTVQTQAQDIKDAHDRVKALRDSLA